MLTICWTYQVAASELLIVDARNEYRAWTNHPYLPYVRAMVCLVRHILPVQRHFVLLQTLPPDLLIAH